MTRCLRVQGRTEMKRRHRGLTRTGITKMMNNSSQHSTLDAQGFHDQQLPVLQDLVNELVEDESLEDYDVWFYSPMALPLMKDLRPRTVIYDCMDELSAFRNAPKQLLQRE